MTDAKKAKHHTKTRPARPFPGTGSISQIAEQPTRHAEATTLHPPPVKWTQEPYI